MNTPQKKIEKQPQYQLGTKVGEKPMEIWSPDITSKQWFWDMAVVS